ncbi:MAG: hypothetical protein J6T45_04610 [Fibrobacterales bacterium]|nr:hypothetical protein [Fibrobacterales bacterium]
MLRALRTRVSAILLLAAFLAWGADQWYGFDWQEAGLSQSEFQAVKRSGMSKEKLEHLLEIGVRPGLYLQKPWERLGVSEEHWLAERSAGMEDTDIDRTFGQTESGRSDAALSLLLPSWYQWKSRQPWKAAAIDLWFASFAGCAVWLTAEGDDDALWLWLGAAAANFYSFIDGMADNPVYDAPDDDLAVAPLFGPRRLGFAARIRF